MSAEEDRKRLVDKLGEARNVIACAQIAARNPDHGEGYHPVDSTLEVALSMIGDVLEALDSEAG